jgi:L-fuculose-phosphate aldolase
LIKTVEQGGAMAAALGTHKAMLLANHGVVFCGVSVGEAACIGVFLEHACRAHIIGRSTGSRALMPSRETRNVRHSQIMASGHVEHTWSYLNRKLDHTLGAPGIAAAAYR